MVSRKLLTISSAFSAGFGLSYFLFQNNKNLNNTFEFDDDCIKKPIFSTLVNSFKAQSQPNDAIVPIRPGSKDTLSLGPSRISELMKHGYPSLDNLRLFENYALSYDRRNKVPNWVFERLTPLSIRPGEDVDRGKSDFKEDTQIHPYFRSTNRDYKG